MKIFLDIDGVMVHANPHKIVEMEEDGFYKFNRQAVEILKSIVYTSKDELILSTSHRFRFNIKQWKKIFEYRGIHIQKLSILDVPIQQKVNRKTEILLWITEHNWTSEEIVIIDDDKSLNELPDNLKERLVLTNSYTGLITETDLKRVLNRRAAKLLART